MELPVIDLDESVPLQERVAAVGKACREFGFFYVRNHGFPQQLYDGLVREGKRFFGQPVEEKRKIPLRSSGLHVRGFFAVGEELTSGKKDHKEGLYFGAELPLDHPKVVAETPMHGPNQWPDKELFPDFKELVLGYMENMTELGHRIMQLVSLSLGLDQGYFSERFTAEPFTPFRLFHYPPDPTTKDENGEQRWGVGEHTDYGVLTILAQDNVGGLQVKHRLSGEWIEAPPLSDTFVVNIGDCLEIWTRGFYRAAPHRVLNVSSSEPRLSIPFFFDPNFEAIVSPLDHLPLGQQEDQGQGGHGDQELPDGGLYQAQEGGFKYGDYILQKVLRVFPGLDKTSSSLRSTTRYVMVWMLRMRQRVH